MTDQFLAKQLQRVERQIELGDRVIREQHSLVAKLLRESRQEDLTREAALLGRFLEIQAAFVQDREQMKAELTNGGQPD